MDTVKLNTKHSVDQTIQPNLRQCIEQQLVDYFEQLGNQSTCSLYDMVIEAVEEPLLQITLKRYDGNQTRTAEALGLSRGTLRKKLAHYQIS